MAGSADDDYGPGRVVFAAVVNGIENRRSIGKPRPVVLIERTGSQWLVAGLTSNDERKDGSKRVPVPNTGAVGLKGRGFVWGWPTRVSVIDVERAVGWVDVGLVEALALAGSITVRQRAELMVVAVAHRVPSRGGVGA